MVIPKGAKFVRIGPLQGYIPQRWNDLPTEAVLKVYASLVAAGYDRLAESEVVSYQRLVVLCDLLRCKPHDLFRVLGISGVPDPIQGEERKEVIDDLNTLLAQVSFCFEEVETEDDAPAQLRMNLSLTRNPYYHLKMPNGESLYGPRDGLENVTIYELASIFTFMSNYHDSKDESDLRLLLATIYRPRKRLAGISGDVRTGLYKKDDRQIVEKRARLWRKAPELVKSLLYFWLQCCRQAIVTSPELAVLFEKSGSRKEDPHGWSGTLLHLANESVVHLDAAATTPWPQALRQLAREKEQALDAEDRARWARR